MKRLKFLDYWILIPYLILSIFGVAMVYSASADIGAQNGGSPFGYLVKQALYVILGFVLVIFSIRVNISKLHDRRLLNGLYWLAILALGFLLIGGQTINGAAGWIRVGGFSLQPAEFVKFFLIIYLSAVVTDGQDAIFLDGWLTTLWPKLFRVGLILVMILLQPDLGGAAINASIVFVILLASGFDWKWAVSGLLGFVAFVGVVVFPALIKLSSMPFAKDSYQLQRVVAFVNPFRHAQTVGQQLVNSYYALGNGGIFGVGWGNSIQKTGYLPEPNTDFIMAILAEELGLIAALAVILLLVLIIARIVLIGIRSNQLYAALVCYGSATYMTVQTLFNLGGVLGMLPITGVTFPFISYGGSSTFTLALVIGLVLNIASRQNQRRAAIIAERREHS